MLTTVARIDESMIEAEELAAPALSNESLDLGQTSLRQAYHEISHGSSHVIEMDVLEQLKTNMTQLDDLHGRLKFMMNEISYLIIR